MTARIYSQAEQVLIWLGPDEHSLDDAMDIYAKVGETILQVGLQHYCMREKFPTLDAAVAAQKPSDPLWQ